MSWWRTGDRYGVLFNRDEQKTRPRADPPAVIDDEFMAPRDPAGSGTWISVNKHGLIIALLNRWEDQTTTRPDLRSRGLLVRDLATIPDEDSLARELQDMDLSRFAPFTLVSIGSKTELRWDWTKGVLTPSKPVCPVSSSSFDTKKVLNARTETFGNLVTNEPGQVALEEFHEESSQGAYSPRMCRPDAQTWSRSHIVVTESRIHWKYLEEFIDFGRQPAAWIATLARIHVPFSE